MVLTTLTPAQAADTSAAARKSTPSAGSSGIGDPYFPTDGNGGYDAKSYDLRIRYHSANGRLNGTAIIRAEAKQALSSFNLDLDDLKVASVRVDGRTAKFKHADGELTVRPRASLKKGAAFRVSVKYAGVPAPDHFLRNGRGALTVGEPEGASSWFPNNDHPADKATYRISMSVDKGLSAVSNGELVSRKKTKNGSTWTWASKEPMVSYLATMAIGNYKLHHYTANGIKYTDVIAKSLFRKLGPKTGSRFLMTGRKTNAYQAFGRTISVPAGGAQVDFSVDRQTEGDSDYFFVSARPAGSDAWTTLPDLRGHSSQASGNVCAGLVAAHPMLSHFLTPGSNDTCTPTGSTGAWNAASGRSRAVEPWRVDLSAYAGKSVELAFTYVSDGDVNMPGVAVDDVAVSTGEGSTSFEQDADTNDGWAAIATPSTRGAWVNATAAVAPKSTGKIVQQAFTAQSKQIAFFEKYFGSYPFTAAGGIVDDFSMIPLGWARQTRTIYPSTAFSTVSSGRFWQSHEIAHQWFGDSVSLHRWSDVWLNEGIGFYATWMWREHQGLAGTQKTFDKIYASVPAADPFWRTRIAAPGASNLFTCPVFVRGPMTMQQLRNKVGDRTFFRIIKKWTSTREGGNGTTAQFIRLAEKESGRSLDTLFDRWLYSSGKPTLSTKAASAAAASDTQPGDGTSEAGRYLTARYTDEIAAGRCFNAGLTPTG